MSMTQSDIVSKVRAVVDELMENDSSFLTTSEDEKNLTAIIKSVIPHALIYLIENAPAEKLSAGSMTGISTYDTGSFEIDATSKVGKCKLDGDVLRVVSAKLSSWTHTPVIVAEQSEVALMQTDKYARGSWDRPVVVMENKSGERWLKLYSAKETTDTLTVLAFRKPTIDENTSIDVPATLESAFIYEVAALAMTAFREQLAPSLFEIANRYAGIVTNS